MAARELREVSHHAQLVHVRVAHLDRLYQLNSTVNQQIGDICVLWNRFRYRQLSLVRGKSG